MSGRWLHCRRLGSVRTGRLRLQQTFGHGARVAKATGELLAAAVLLDEVELVRARVALLVDVRARAHQRTQDDLSVVLKEVDLRQKYAKLQEFPATNNRFHNVM